MYSLVGAHRCGGGDLQHGVKKNYEMWFDVHTSITFKKKWKPALQETLGDEGELMFKQQNGIDV